MKYIAPRCQACNAAPATGMFLVEREYTFPFVFSKTLAERLCAACGLVPPRNGGTVVRNDLLHSFLDSMPTDVPPALKQTALTHLAPEATTPSGQTIVELITNAKRRGQKSTVHPGVWGRA